MPHVSAGNKGKRAAPPKPVQKNSAPKKAVQVKKASAAKAAKPPAGVKASKAPAGKNVTIRGDRLLGRKSQAEMPFAKIMGNVMARTSPTTGRNFEHGMTELTRWAADYIVPELPGAAVSRRPTKQSPASAGFARAYEKMLASVPKRNRRVFLEAMRKGLDLAEKSAKIDQVAQTDDQESAESTASFMAQLRAQEMAQREKNAQSGQLLPGAEMASRLGLTTQALSAALRTRRLFALTGPKGEFLYPAFFAASDKYDRRVLEQVSKALGTLPAGSKWNFFTTPLLSLNGRTPLDALGKGKIEEVLDAAHALAEE
jgi:hypothetical protein